MSILGKGLLRNPTGASSLATVVIRRIHRMLEGIQLMVDRVLDLQEIPISN
ncbi:hypothetical protein QF043_000778 [Pseudomonas sp. W3I7]|uniref:hypothetical protein n=1 Tax=Pseudomonas sp. W3I7 TaxID=3042292 RepID=UPI00278D66D8|nr:hypothetical protein [Pseudomonas sp. W3I7]MDQ0701986.1 hypothetical protein [Pseudomonas sp. W3I7]